MVSRSANEFVSEAVDGQNALAVTRIGLQLLPQPGDMDIHGPRHWGGLIAPDLLQQFLSGDNFFTMNDQVLQQVVFAGREFHWRAAASDFSAAEIYSTSSN